MKRNISNLTEKEFDVLIIGAGMFGVCAAWEAIMQGLSVAIVEKGDFCQATSANHYKMVHGGIRYIQHGDIKRIEESSRERSAFLRIAPHLVTPLPIVISTYGYGIKGKGALRVGTAAYDILTLNRNAGIKDKERHIPLTKFISKKEVLDLFPGVNKDGLTGAGIFSDAQMYNPPRLALSFLKSAVEHGAEAANYLEVVDILSKGNKVYGVRVKDWIDQGEFEIRSKVTLNTAGPWANELLEKTLNLNLNPKPAFSRDAAFIVKKKPGNKYTLASLLKTKDVDTILDRGGRHLFIVPWLDRNITMVGVWHVVWAGTKDHLYVTDEELDDFVKEVNESYPEINLTVDDISMVNTGLTLFGETTPGSKRMSFGKRSLLIDHSQTHSIEGLVTLIGVRATIARGMAEKVIKLIGSKLGKSISKSRTEYIPIYGGDIGIFEDYLQSALNGQEYNIDSRVMRALIHNYGSSYKEVMKYISEDNSLAETIGNSTVLSAEIVHAIKDEMATNLADVVLRRTDLGTAGDPGKVALESCAKLLAKELNWNNNKLNEELEQLNQFFSRKGAIKDYASSAKEKYSVM
jgi:glycerol-3-phosphate dehydrogenase